MSDLMNWLYDHYIHPQIENQPQDDADELHFAILESALMEAEKQDLEYRFWELSNGGKIQYVKYPISYNKEAIRTLA